MPKSISASVMFHNNVNRIPQVEELRASIRHVLIQLHGEIGAGSFVFDFIPDSFVILDKKVVNFTIKLIDPTDKTSLAKFVAGLTLMRVIGTEKVSFRVVSTN